MFSDFENLSVLQIFANQLQLSVLWAISGLGFFEISRHVIDQSKLGKAQIEAWDQIKIFDLASNTTILPKSRLTGQFCFLSI